MNNSIATLTIVSLSPMSQSRQHTVPKLEGERLDDYDARTWRDKLNLNYAGTHVVIPAHGFQQAVAAAAKYSKRQIPGQGKATWTAKFTAGLMLLADPEIDTPLDKVFQVAISANADGVRGSGKRVVRRFPMIPMGWTSTFEIHILDPIITQPVMAEMLEIAGMFIGLGRFRPEKGGTNGRFRVQELTWDDNRKTV